MVTHECDNCGRSFDTEHGLAIHESTGHAEPYQDKETLEELYHEQGLNQREIAERFDVHRVVILRWMDRFGIETNDTADPTYPPCHTFNKRSDRGVGNEYEVTKTTIDGEEYAVRLHRLIAVAHGIIEPEELFNPDINVHHKSRHGLDNRPENLEAMTHSEHTTHHNIELEKVPPFVPKG